jgi:hypothetical protein
MILHLPDFGSLLFSLLLKLLLLGFFLEHSQAFLLTLLVFLVFKSFKVFLMAHDHSVCVDFLNIWVKNSYLLFFLLVLGRSLTVGFQPIGSGGFTRELNGKLPVRSGFLYRPNSFGRLQSITPL